jgi:Ca2+-binding EF-hand superfamily protein
MDDDNSKSLSLEEFTKAVKDYRVGFEDKMIKAVFNAVDRDHTGAIDYEEFLRAVRGPMNQNRIKFVEMAFKKLDKDGSGTLEVTDLKDVYNAKQHPDVKSGKKTEEEVLGEFLETFEMHFNIGGGEHDQKITKDEFLEYYNNVSASIDDDKYFEQMMTAAWKLSGATTTQGAWRSEYAANKEKGKSSQTPYGTSEAPVDYKSTTTTHHTNAKEDVKSVAAGTKTKSTESPQKGAEKQLVETFRTCLLSRGARGIFGLRRVFKVTFCY